MFKFSLLFLLSLLLCVVTSFSRASIIDNNNNSKVLIRWKISGHFPVNSSFGDPHRFKIASSNYQVAFVYSHPSRGTVLVSLDPMTGVILLEHQISNSAFPVLSGWVATAITGVDQHRSVCPSRVCFYVGTMRGVVAISGDTGKRLWERELFTQQQFVPAHVTWIPWRQSQEGVVMLTFENGVKSSNIFALRCRDGQTVFPSSSSSSSSVVDDQEINNNNSDDMVAYTLLWPIVNFGSSISVKNVVSGVVYGSYNTSSKKLGITCRVILNTSSFVDSFVSKVLWSNMSYKYSRPGLWDNPNLDVDLPSFQQRHQTPAIFSYEEPSQNFRQVSRLDLLTGKQLWTSNIFTDVIDYDTYAYQNNFVRLMLRKNHSLQLEKLDGNRNGERVWEFALENYEDSNAILLVGDNIVCSFGLLSGKIDIIDERNGNFIGRIQLPKYENVVITPTTGVAVPINEKSESEKTLLLFGDNLGNFYAFEILF